MRSHTGYYEADVERAPVDITKEAKETVAFPQRLTKAMFVVLIIR